MQIVDQIETGEAAALAAALAGDQEAFGRLIAPYERQLHLHCYRLLGSIQDAEDALQETWVRAWRSLASFERRASLRAWLYRIATNVCLNERARASRAPRVGLGPFADGLPSTPEPAVNLSPYPDAWIEEVAATSGDPAAAYDLRESVQLAFVAALQLLPPRQRAVLILRDVLGWSAAEVADLLHSTTASVNGALARARSHLQQQRLAGRLRGDRRVEADSSEQSIAQRLADALRSADVGALAGLLARDVVLTMPPLPLGFRGSDAAIAFLSAAPAMRNSTAFRFIPVRVNLQPALAVYRRETGEDDEPFEAWGIFALGTEHDRVVALTAFVDSALLPALGLPATADA
jgi:RNA polymerase sigma-70 factor (ECF subfamily)